MEKDGTKDLCHWKIELIDEEEKLYKISLPSCEDCENGKFLSGGRSTGNKALSMEKDGTKDLCHWKIELIE